MRQKGDLQVFALEASRLRGERVSAAPGVELATQHLDDEGAGVEKRSDRARRYRHLAKSYLSGIATT